MKTKKIYLFVVAILVLSLVFGIWYHQKNSQDAQKKNTESEVSTIPKVYPKVIAYQGNNGRTALEILKSFYKVQTKTFSGIGEYVVSIDGISETQGKNFWAFYVDGNQAKVGASDYKTKNTETIEWKLEDIKPGQQ